MLINIISFNWLVRLNNNLNKMVHILLYAPNVIGYIRLLFMVLSWNEALTNPNRFIIFYAISYLMDMADGFAARTLNQWSKFGAVLDMVLDRVWTASLFAILASLYSDYAVVFYFFLGLDLSSHWLQVTSTYMAGDLSHKGDNKSETFIVRLYYKSRFVLTLLCAWAEFFGCALYWMAKAETKWLLENPIIQIMFAISTVGFVLKQFINLVQIKNSTLRLIEAENLPPKKSN